MLKAKVRYGLATLFAVCAALVAYPAPASAAPPDYLVSGEACHNHSYYFMGWAQVEADCLTINASTVNEDKGRVDLVGWSHTWEFHVSLALDCLVVEKHSDTGRYTVFASGVEEDGTRYSLMLIGGTAIPEYWAGSPTGSAPCNAYEHPLQANQEAGGFTVAALSPDLNQRPSASFTYSCDNYVCSFDASPSFDPDGDIVSYRWKTSHEYGSFVSHGSGRTFTHDFGCNCTWNVTLTVVDEDGGAATYTEKIQSTSSVYAVISFQCSSLTCTFDASGSYDENGTIEHYRWSFGDGSEVSSTSPTITHTYGSPGGYYAYLWVTDNDGNLDRAVTRVEVELAYELTAEARRQGKRTKIILRWTGALGDQVWIRRDGTHVATVDASTGSWSEYLSYVGSTINYQVCDAGTNRCSNTASVAP